MYPKIVQLWKQTRLLPEEQQTLVNQLFAFIEHTNEKLMDHIEQRPTTETRYYQPNWFNDVRVQ
jgi:hypothetical protein